MDEWVHEAAIEPGGPVFSIVVAFGVIIFLVLEQVHGSPGSDNEGDQEGKDHRC